VCVCVCVCTMASSLKPFRLISPQHFNTIDGAQMQGQRCRTIREHLLPLRALILCFREHKYENIVLPGAQI